MSAIAEMSELRPSVPAPYQRADLPTQSSRAPDAHPTGYLKSDQVIMPLWDLQIGDQTVKPTVPVGIRLRREGDYFFAENDSLSIYTSGLSPEEAIADFKEMAGCFAQEYRGLAPEQVIGLGETLREIFVRLFPAK